MECRKRRGEPLESIEQSHLCLHMSREEGQRDLSNDPEKHSDSCSHVAKMARGAVDVEEEPIQLVLGNTNGTRRLACLLRACVVEAEDLQGDAEGADEVPSSLGCYSYSEKFEETEGEPAIKRCQLRRTEDDEVVHISVSRDAKVAEGYGD